jgi:hypothetical protein
VGGVGDAKTRLVDWELLARKLKSVEETGFSVRWNFKPKNKAPVNLWCGNGPDPARAETETGAGTLTEENETKIVEENLEGGQAAARETGSLRDRRTCARPTETKRRTSEASCLRPPSCNQK